MRVSLFAVLVLVVARVQAAPFSFESFSQAIQQKKIRTVERALAELPAEFWQHFVLLRHSDSRQGATPEFPRVLLFGREADLILAFNGDPSQPGHDSLEMMQFRESERRYEFREIQFPNERNRLDAVKISAANPKQCRSCHQQSLRPNWAQYPDWPGTYGSIDDTLDGTEKTDYLAFVKRMPSLERYRRLVRRGRDEIAPFSQERFGKFDRRPNLYFTKLVTRRHAATLAHRLLSRETADALAVSMSVLGCTDIPQSGIARLARLLGKDEKHVHVLMLSSLAGELNELTYQAVGISPADWNLDFIPEGENTPDGLGYRFFDGLFHIDELLRIALASELTEKYPDLKTLVEQQPYSYDLEGQNPMVAKLLESVNRLGGSLKGAPDALCAKLREHLERP